MNCDFIDCNIVFGLLGYLWSLFDFSRIVQFYLSYGYFELKLPYSS